MPKEKLQSKSWKEKGVVIVTAHPDDEALFFGTILQLKKAGVPITVIVMTLGELGSLHGVPESELTNERVKEVRRKELENGMKAIGASYEILPFADFALRYEAPEKLEVALLDVVRRIQPAAIFSFLDQEVTFQFDHPDHNTTGHLARVVGAGSDMQRYPNKENFPNAVPAMDRRPELYLWTTDKGVATHTVKLTKPERRTRNEYLKTHYPSQFSEADEKNWSKIFDNITKKKKSKKGKKKQREYFKRVR